MIQSPNETAARTGVTGSGATSTLAGGQIERNRASYFVTCTLAC
jgi:hypothetical protein